MWESVLYAAFVFGTLWSVRKSSGPRAYAYMILVMWVAFHVASWTLSYHDALTVNVCVDAIACVSVLLTCGRASVKNWRFVIFLALFVQIADHQWFGALGEPKARKFTFDFILFRMLDVQLIAVNYGAHSGWVVRAIEHAHNHSRAVAREARNFFYAPPCRHYHSRRLAAESARRRAKAN